MAHEANEAERKNEILWDELAPVHFRAYQGVERLRRGEHNLDEIELAQVGDVKGKSLLHLQCHIGTDSLSWSRLGAKVTGVDFSAKSLEAARGLNEELGFDAKFLQANVYDLPDVLNEQFDIVYTSRGVLCWLKDIDAWARIVAKFMKPGGLFFIEESHPIGNVFDDTTPSELIITYPYFHDKKPTVWDDDYPDYADASYTPKNASYEWTWSTADIINAIIKAGLRLELFEEYDLMFYERFPGMKLCEDGWYRFPRYDGKLPQMFALRAFKDVN